MHRSTKIKRIAAVAGLSAALTVPNMGSVNAHSFNASSRVSITATNKGWSGSVSSSRRACRSKRPVVIIKVFRDGDKKVFSRTSTNPKGNYFVNRPGATGKYYAKVVRTVRGAYGHSHRCQAARSGPVRKR